MTNGLNLSRSMGAVLRLFVVSIAFTFAVSARAEIQSFFYTFQSGNKVEYQVDSARPDAGRVLYHLKGNSQPRILRDGVRFTEINFHKNPPNAGRSYFSTPTSSLRWLEKREIDPLFPDPQVWFNTDQAGAVFINERGAIGHIPFPHSNVKTLSVRTDTGEEYLVISLNNIENPRSPVPGTYVIRSRDDKIAKVSDHEVRVDRMSLPAKDGILAIPGVPDKFDLNTFSVIKAEPEASLAKEAVHDEKNAAQLAAIPFKGWKEHSHFTVTHGNDKYLVVSLTGEPAAKGTYVIRSRDNLLVKIDHEAADLRKGEYSVEDGILNIRGVRRKVDLDEFYGESRFQASRIKDVVLDKDGNAINSTERVFETYKKDYVAMAKADPSDFFEKADPEIVEQLAEALRGKRSAVVLGEAGTGKTSAMRALAREIAQGKVPGLPRTLKILEVPASSIQSGASQIGIVDERINTLKAAAQDGGIVYAIDEIQSLSGVGSHSNKSTDVTQDIKPGMEKGEFLTLAASTDHEFKNAFAKDPAFMDRFDLVHLKEPVGEGLIEMVAQKMAREYPKAKPNRAIIEEAIHLSNDLDVRTRQPRAAVNLMKKAYAILEGRKGNEGTTVPDSAVLKQAAVKKYGVDPARFNREATRKNLAELDKGLEDRIVGNANGKRAVKSVWKRKLTGVGDPESVNTILFRGPPGTGKTMLSKASAEEMGYEYTVVEMNKFARSHDAVEDFRREIYSELMKNPFRVIVLDEIEKAPIAVQDAALSMLQDGKFRVIEKLSGGGEVPRDVKAKHVVFMITTNAAGDTPELTGDALKEALHRGGISEPLLSRVETIEFLKRPSSEEFNVAVTKTLHQTLERESEKQKAKFVFANEQEYINKLMKNYTPASDYRDVKKLIRKEVDDTISDAVLHFRDDVQYHGKVELHWHPEHQALKFKCMMDQIKKTMH